MGTALVSNFPDQLPRPRLHAVRSSQSSVSADKCDAPGTLGHVFSRLSATETAKLP
jgi:hypothetical protein